MMTVSHDTSLREGKLVPRGLGLNRMLIEKKENQLLF